MSLVQRAVHWWRRLRRRAGLPPPADARAVRVEPAFPPVVDGPAVDEPAPVAAPLAGECPTHRPPDPRGRVRLALQGGGSHGAFTWGVLDALLERDDIEVDAISGASAGALNGAVLASGWARAGRSGARDALHAFWEDVALTGGHAWPFLQSPGSGQLLDFGALPGVDWATGFLRTLSPYAYNPLNLNPLRDLLERHVDVAALRDGPIRVFATATSVRTGEPRIFSGDALDVDALLASACLPFLFHAVKIGGEAYWDGGYSGNPSIHPLFDADADCDIVVVRINPAVRDGVPRTSADILDRINEITFNASLVGELRMIGQVERLRRQFAVAGQAMPRCRVHVLADDVDLATLPASSRMRVDASFVERLRGYGRAAADRFLAEEGRGIGRPSGGHADAGKDERATQPGAGIDARVAV